MAARGKVRVSPGHATFGRQSELQALLALCAPEGPELAVLTGIPGIGKSALLHSFALAASARGVRALLLDCRTVEPTVRGFEQALADAKFDSGPDRIGVVCLDHYDHFQLLDAWLRAWLERGLDEGRRLVLSGRQAPSLGWSSSAARALNLRLDVLDDTAALALLQGEGIDDGRARRILGVTKGHPLALRLAAAASRQESPPDLATMALPDVVRRLTGFFLEDVPEPELRAALEAAACVRRVTRPLLASMLEQKSANAIYDRLAALPVVEVRSDGLSLHPTVHAAVAQWLRAADPARFTACRRRAWQALERDAGNVGAGDLWRYTADVVYLLEDPIVREAFFPSDARAHAVEPARAADHASALEIAAAHDGPGELQHIARWLQAMPEAFHVVRDAQGVVQGFYCLIDAASAPAAALAADPLTRAWHADLPRSMRGERRRALFLRRWLSRAHGDQPSPVQAACWLDVKRAYLDNRPALRRVYLAVRDLAPYAAAASKLGFVPFAATGHELASAMLDFGPGSVDAWLARLLRAELGIAEAVAVDADAHGLRLGDATLPLTPRELAFTRILVAARGAVVTREQLLAQAWDGGHSVGSNVVDVLVRGLRKKLGDAAAVIETVRGVGYRWRT